MAENAPTVTTPAAAPRAQRGMLSLMASPRGLWRFLRDPAAPWAPKLVTLLAAIYVVVPTDLVPDLAPIIGWLDDLGLTAVAMAFVASQAAKYERAHEDPAIAVKPADKPAPPTSASGG